MSIKYQCSLLVATVVFLLACPYSSAYFGMQTLPEFQLNPNMRCPGKNEEANIWRPCKHGGFIENPDPKNCEDRYVCYKGLGEYCDPGDKCAGNAICTMCGICEICESADKCRLCPDIRGYKLFEIMQKKNQAATKRNEH